MNLFDPQRPINPIGRPMILGSRQMIVPTFHFLPISNMELRVSGMFLVDEHPAYKDKVAMIHPLSVAQFMRNLYEDPEETFRLYFQWDYLNPIEFHKQAEPKRNAAVARPKPAPITANFDLPDF